MTAVDNGTAMAAVGAAPEITSLSLVLACIVVVGLISATSLMLASSIGLSAHSRAGGNGEYIYQGRNAEELRAWILTYPNWTLCFFVGFALAILYSYFVANVPSFAVAFAILHVTIAVRRMQRLCSRALAVAADDRGANRDPPRSLQDGK